MSFPVVPLDSIPTPGLDVTVGDWALGACARGLGGASSAVSGALHVAREGRDVGVRGEVHGTAEVRCDRCGAPLAFSAVAEVDCLYLATRADDEAPPETEYAEVGEYDGVALDLGHVVAESLALERPYRVLCGDVDPAQDAACHARWKEQAGTPESVPDPRLSALKNFKPVQ